MQAACAQLALANGVTPAACGSNIATGTGTLTAPGNAAPPPPPNPAEVARGLAESLTKTLPSPGIDMSPKVGDNQLVNIPGGTWLWVSRADWHDVTVTASVPGEVVSVTASPVSVTWQLTDSPQNGQRVCNGPGTPYQPSVAPEDQTTDCSYTFRHASDAHDVTASITWQVTWFATGGFDAAGTFDPMTTSATVTARVVQDQSVNSAR